EQRRGVAVPPLAGQRQREAQRGTRAVVAQLHRVVERGRRRSEATGVEIGAAEHRAIGGVVRLGEDGGFGVRDRLGGLAAGERGFRLACREVGRGGGAGGAAAQQRGGDRGGGDPGQLRAWRAAAGCGTVHRRTPS